MKKVIAALAIATASGLALSGCAAPSAPGPGDDTRVQVVASTNVYGSLAAQIGGERVVVTSIITSFTQDPHSYEATARDRLAVQRAELVIENGGGYDPFMQRLSEGSSAHVITAVAFSHDFPGSAGHDDNDHADHGNDHDHDDDHADHDHIEGFNEHIWFDVHTMIHLVEAIAEELAEIDPAGETQFAAAAASINEDLRALEELLEELEHEFSGTGVFITEPLPGYLAASVGLVDLAPDGFSSAVEEGTDVAPATLLAAIAVIASGEVTALLSNAQTGGAETDRIESEAVAAGVPVVSFTELLPEGKTYAEWMQDAINSLAAALRA